MWGPPRKNLAGNVGYTRNRCWCGAVAASTVFPIDIFGHHRRAGIFGSRPFLVNFSLLTRERWHSCGEAEFSKVPVVFGLSPILHGEESTMGSGGQDPAGCVADGVAWSPSSIQPVDEVEPIRHSECSEKHEGARGEGEASTPPRGVFASRGGARSRPQASCEISCSFGHVGRQLFKRPRSRPRNDQFPSRSGSPRCSSAENKRGSSRPGWRPEGGFVQSSNRTGGASIMS